MPNRKADCSALEELPLPELRDTVQRTLQWLRPQVSDAVYLRSEAACAEFLQNSGPKLQAALYAQNPDTHEKRWHDDVVRALRLHNHRSLPLSGNLALVVNWQAPQRGIKRVAHFIHALLHVHRDYLTDKLAPAVNAEGEPLCMAQYAILGGCSRRPQIPCDVYHFAPPGCRHIVVIRGGHGFKIDVFDARMRIANPAQLEKALDDILAAPVEETEIPFGAPSVLPAQQALEIRAQLISRDDNRRIWQNLEEALFVVSLNSERHDDSTDGLHDALFSDAAEQWAYKPLNYCCDYRDDRIYLHAETAFANASVLRDILRRAQQYQQLNDYERKNNLPARLDVEALDWTIEQNTRELLQEALAQYHQQAEKMALFAVDIFITDEERRALAPLPSNALILLLLQYAQYEVYGDIRSIRVPLDMRHFRYGRQDILRPLTDASLAAVEAMHTGQLSENLLKDSMQAHQARLAECKAGQGIHYHLQALHEANRQSEEPSDFFRDEGLLRLQEDFLHTAGLGAYDVAAGMAFAPRHPQGMGIHYAFNRNNINVMLIHRRADLRLAKAFGQALRAGIRQVLNVLMP